MRFLRTLVFATLLISCDESPSDVNRITLTVSPDSAFMLVNDTLELSAVLIDRDSQAVSVPIHWTTSDSSIASVVGGRVIAKRVGRVNILAAAAGATSAVSITVRDIATACAPPYTTHNNFQTTTPTTWRAADSPHLLQGTITASRGLTIEEGSLICADSGAVIRVTGGELRAIGARSKPIRFLPTDSTKGWAGIVSGGTEAGGAAILKHVVIHAATSTGSSFFGSTEIDSSTFRRSAILSGANFSSVSVRNSLIDEGDVAISAGSLENTTVRGGVVRLVPAQPGAGNVRLNGLRIENSPGTALSVGSTFSGRVPVVMSTSPPVIVGTRGPAIVDMPIATFLTLWPTASERAALVGNVTNTLKLWNNSHDADALHLQAGFTWYIYGPLLFGVTVPALTIEPGAALRLGLLLTVNGRMTATGTSDLPVSISSQQPCWSSQFVCGITLSGDSPSELRHLRFENATLTINSPGTRVANFVMQNVPNPEAIRIAANNVRLLACDIRDNAGDGVIVASGAGIQINDCNIERNGGMGIRNNSSNAVDARQNWWGDPAGPSGQNGDGVAGNVDTTLHYTQRRAN